MAVSRKNFSDWLFKTHFDWSFFNVGHLSYININFSCKMFGQLYASWLTDILTYLYINFFLSKLIGQNESCNMIGYLIKNYYDWSDSMGRGSLA